MFDNLSKWPWLTVQIVAANVAVILALATAWYLAFMHQSQVYSDRLMSTFHIEPGQLHAMYVSDVIDALRTDVKMPMLIKHRIRRSANVILGRIACYQYR